jgi:hypothetical protein
MPSATDDRQLSREEIATRQARRPRRSGAVRLSDGLGDPVTVRKGSRRERIRSNPALYQPYRVAVFAAGLVCIAIGIALAALPGPLTIPPVLLGLWIWSSEFAWADRFFEAFKEKARSTWAHAKEHPATSVAVTVGGLLAAGAAFWAVQHFELVDQAKTALL